MQIEENVKVGRGNFNARRLRQAKITSGLRNKIAETQILVVPAHFLVKWVRRSIPHNIVGENVCLQIKFREHETCLHPSPVFSAIND